MVGAAAQLLQQSPATGEGSQYADPSVLIDFGLRGGAGTAVEKPSLVK